MLHDNLERRDLVAGDEPTDPDANLLIQANVLGPQIAEYNPPLALQAESAQSGPTSLSALEGSGVTTADLKKPADAGFTTVESIAFSTKKQIAEVKGISEAKADKVIASAAALVPMGFCTANDYHQ
jgi:hypothetical protein